MLPMIYNLNYCSKEEEHIFGRAAPPNPSFPLSLPYKTVLSGFCWTLCRMSSAEPNGTHLILLLYNLGNKSAVTPFAQVQPLVSCPLLPSTSRILNKVGINWSWTEPASPVNQFNENGNNCKKSIAEQMKWVPKAHLCKIWDNAGEPFIVELWCKPTVNFSKPLLLYFKYIFCLNSSVQFWCFKLSYVVYTSVHYRTLKYLCFSSYFLFFHLKKKNTDEQHCILVSDTNVFV